MQEDVLHYIWKHKAFESSNLKTTDGEDVAIVQLGQHNHNAGPDFFNARIRIGEQLWAGNVEIHIKSSDWYVHNHEIDKAYDNVILHVVWEHDTEIFRKDNSVLPTLELKDYVSYNLISKYRQLMRSKSWINCEAHFSEVDDFLLNNWLERLYIERLERKSDIISQLLKSSNNDWEAVLFKMLLKNFGLKVNGEAFFSLATSIDFAVFRKLQGDVLDMEALLFGQARLLTSETIEENHFYDLRRRYEFQKKKFNLENNGVLPLQFFRLRPPNFPTIRLSQFANLYALEPNLFSKILDLNRVEEFYDFFNKGVSEFWMTHYTFGKTSKISKKMLTKTFIDLLIINTIIPLKFSYAKAQEKTIVDVLFQLIKSIKMEKNSVVSKFLDLKPIEKHALSSQALLQLKNNYCDNNKCLHCAIGNSLIVKN
ncbi:uncharacterized protein DUF2851 [Winogradskyella epiphytica]|uniref:Uncharacterized protein DUF2851 n=1 Tax=Winogradskyella epiphytica TaxID=262005 RepID=A0A2V4WTX2_9FLAO|nr:DUF2851 family protein [Winogradskyella epiphytica]PYE80102.1 uncharacterized protein DUF2851 [Winogradskyella epiphytica]GGW71421.1 hypothetical protein GCM10008085_24340 [Winogradskyella epiphytica]